MVENVGKDRRRAQFGIVFVPGVAEDDLRRAAEEARGDRMGEIPVILGRGVGHAILALDGGGQQRMRAARKRPVRVVSGKKPEGVEVLAGRFEGPENLDGSIGGFGSENCFGCVKLEQGEEFSKSQGGTIEIEQSEVIEEARPALERLKLHGVGCPLAGPAEGIEEEMDQLSPCRGRAGLAEDLVDLDGLKKRLDPIRQRAERGIAAEAGEEAGERSLRHEQARVAACSIAARELEMVGCRIGEKS